MTGPTERIGPLGLSVGQHARRTKTVTARWPSGIKEGAQFQMPTYGLDA